MNKKADKTVNLMITIFLVLILAGIVLWAFLKPAGETGSKVSQQYLGTGLQLDYSQCIQKWGKTGVPDADGDHVPDACDRCRGARDIKDFSWPEYQQPSFTVNDRDADGIPDACDLQPDRKNKINTPSDLDGVCSRYEIEDSKLKTLQSFHCYI